MTLAPTERDYFNLFIALDEPGPEQINRSHKKNKRFFVSQPLRTRAFIRLPSIQISTQLFPCCTDFGALCRESRQAGFPALFPGVNMILAIEDLSSRAASIATLLVVLFGSIQLLHNGHTWVNFQICIIKPGTKSQIYPARVLKRCMCAGKLATSASRIRMPLGPQAGGDSNISFPACFPAGDDPPLARHGRRGLN